MVLLAAQLRKRAFGINLSEVKFHRRGFVAGDPVIRQRLEAIGGEFLRGYHLALEAGQPDGLELLLNAGCP